MAKQWKQKRVRHTLHTILWHSNFSDCCSSRFALLMPAPHFGQRQEPVSRIHFFSWASLSRAAVFALCSAACSSQVLPWWYGCAWHCKQCSLPQKLQSSLRVSPSLTATRLGQSGVGQAHSSALAPTAVSREPLSNLSYRSGGNTARKTAWLSKAVQQGHFTTGSPSSARAAECLRKHTAQNQLWPQVSSSAVHAGTSSRHMLHVTS
mmetsp:Transcript_35939/g.65989  ORF Transcript_35939/g.65989 Transcript_35939/m.65989 type:complete len:207 (-) Transcript_35939:313-933(-)